MCKLGDDLKESDSEKRLSDSVSSSETATWKCRYQPEQIAEYF